jgi:hypothetical protein
MRWQQGRETLDSMIARGELERVPASREHADVMLAQARQHLASATPSVSAEEVERDVPKVEQIIDVAARVLDQMSPL